MKSMQTLKQWFDNLMQPKKARAVLSESTEGAMRAAIVRHNRDAAASAYRKNTRGLPKGIGVHQLRAAKRLKNRLSNKRDEGVIGDSRVFAADTVLDVVKHNAMVRAANPRPRKLARWMAAAH